jgi:hypothetical protein
MLRFHICPISAKPSPAGLESSKSLLQRHYGMHALDQTAIGGDYVLTHTQTILIGAAPKRPL